MEEPNLEVGTLKYSGLACQAFFKIILIYQNIKGTNIETGEKQSFSWLLLVSIGRTQFQDQYLYNLMIEF